MERLNEKIKIAFSVSYGVRPQISDSQSISVVKRFILYVNIIYTSQYIISPHSGAHSGAHSVVAHSGERSSA